MANRDVGGAYHIVRSENDPITNPEFELWTYDYLMVGMGINFNALRQNIIDNTPPGEDSGKQLLFGSHNTHGIVYGFPDPTTAALVAAAETDTGMGDGYLYDKTGTTITEPVPGQYELDPFDLECASRIGEVLADAANDRDWDGIYWDDYFTIYPDYLLAQIERTTQAAEIIEAFDYWRKTCAGAARAKLQDHKTMLANIGQSAYTPEMDAITIEYPSDRPGAREAFSQNVGSRNRANIENVAWYEGSWGLLAVTGTVQPAP